MKIGVCISPEKIAAAASAGFDYIELPASKLFSLNESEYSDVKKTIKENKIIPEVFNVFLPGSLKVVGPDVNKQEINEYMLKVIGRVSSLGGKVIVFGSGVSRMSPAGWPVQSALSQYIDAANTAGEIGSENGVIIALEHLNKKETNIVNSVSEAWKAALDSKNANVKVIIDSYHMNMEKESFEILKDMSGYIAHAHIARSQGRYYPMEAGEDSYLEFIESLRAGGYDQRISIEGSCSDFSTEAPKALAFLKSII